MRRRYRQRCAAARKDVDGSGIVQMDPQEARAEAEARAARMNRTELSLIEYSKAFGEAMTPISRRAEQQKILDTLERARRSTRYSMIFRRRVESRSPRAPMSAQGSWRLGPPGNDRFLKRATRPFAPGARPNHNAVDCTLPASGKACETCISSHRSGAGPRSS